MLPRRGGDAGWTMLPLPGTEADSLDIAVSAVPQLAWASRACVELRVGLP